MLEDKNQKVQIFGLEEINVPTPDDMRDIIEEANAVRTTHNTVTNEVSSRSHAVCNVSYFTLLNLMLLDNYKRTRIG